MGAHTPPKPRRVDEIAEAIASAGIFAAVARNSLRQLAGRSELISVHAGDTVLRRGDPGDAFYVVRSGLLEVLSGVEDRDRVRLLRAGVPFGELALLSGEPRTATVRAVRDSDVWRVPRSAFDSLLGSDATFPRAMVHALTQLVFESQPEAASNRASSQVIAVVPLHEDAPADAAADGFALALGGEDRRGVVIVRDAGVPAGWGHTVESLERSHAHVVLVASPTRDEWFRFCERESDRVVAVARAGATFEAPTAGIQCDLVLFGAAGGGAVERALRTVAPRAHHLVAGTDPRAGLAAAARRVTGRSVGLILSGGGARGIAHIGVLRALEDAGILVDRIGGTSMGALVGALSASGRSPRAVERSLHRELVERKPFADYAIPRVALIRAKRARALLERLFANIAVEELARDFFCLSADLVSAESVVHRNGSLVTAVGASMSLPGLAPPIRDGDRLLVDGGVLDNLPIEIMAATGEGPVIAVDVLARGLPGRRSSRLGDASLPSIVETLARSSTLASRGRADRQRALATLAIVPDLDGIGLLDFGRFDAIVDAGRTAADKALVDAPPTLMPC